MDSENAPSQKKQGSRKALEDFLIANVGRVLTADELRTAANNASEWGRRLRELRDEVGYQIKSHKDDPKLKPGEYRLDTLDKNKAEKRDIDKKLRAQVLSEAAGVCQWCGAVAGKPHPQYPEKTTTLQVSHVVDKAKGGTDTLNNLIALCSICNEGASVETKEPPRDVQILSGIRRAPKDVQKAVYERLREMFDPKK